MGSIFMGSSSFIGIWVVLSAMVFFSKQQRVVFETHFVSLENWESFIKFHMSGQIESNEMHLDWETEVFGEASKNSSIV